MTKNIPKQTGCTLFIVSFTCTTCTEAEHLLWFQNISISAARCDFKQIRLQSIVILRKDSPIVKDNALGIYPNNLHITDVYDVIGF